MKYLIHHSCARWCSVSSSFLFFIHIFTWLSPLPYPTLPDWVRLTLQRLMDSWYAHIAHIVLHSRNPFTPGQWTITTGSNNGGIMQTLRRRTKGPKCRQTNTTYPHLAGCNCLPISCGVYSTSILASPYSNPGLVRLRRGPGSGS